jgi:hypothetical protein
VLDAAAIGKGGGKAEEIRLRPGTKVWMVLSPPRAPCSGAMLSSVSALRRCSVSIGSRVWRSQLAHLAGVQLMRWRWP